MSSAASISKKHLERLANDCGLNLLGTTDLAPFKEARKYLEEWQQKGFCGDMWYMQRPSSVLAEPRALFADARSIVVLGVFYDRAPLPPRLSGQGRVARYAWGKDYHEVLQSRVKALVSAVEGALDTKLVSRVVSDAVPFLERAAAQRAGLGFYGKNSMLIRAAGEGSYFFLAEVFWNVEIADAVLSVITQDCGSCVRCAERCPTKAIVNDFVVDARRCISYLSIEKRGSLAIWEREALGEWIFGCDVCQEVCPFNHAALVEERGPDLDEFKSEAGVGALLDLNMVLGLRDTRSFRDRFQGTAIMRTKREGLLRNAAVVAANTASMGVVPSLLMCAFEDRSEVVRQHALWALWKLEKKCNIWGGTGLTRLLERGLKDPSALVVQEVKDLLS